MADTEEKKKKPIKMYLILGGVGLFVILLIVANVDTARKNKQTEGTDTGDVTSVTEYADSDFEESTETQLSEAELLQLALIDAFGEPPVGFRWDEDGELVPLSDETLTSEEVAWRYLQALSNKDFATAQKYAQTGFCINTYESFYNDNSYSTSDLTSKIYSEAIGSMEILGCKQNGVFANGKFVFTFTANMIDLSDKTFWETNSEEVFNTIKSYMNYEGDSLKAEMYVNDLIVEYYKSPDAKKKQVTFDIVVDKVTLGGYLVSDDSSLDSACRYMNGTTVYQYIMEKYADWVSEQSK